MEKPVARHQPPLPVIAGIPAWCVGVAVAVAAGVAVVVRGTQDLLNCGVLLLAIAGVSFALGTLRHRYLTVAMLAATWSFGAVALAASGYELRQWVKWQGYLTREPEELTRQLEEVERVAQRCRDRPSARGGEPLSPAALAAATRARSAEIVTSARANVVQHRRGFCWTLPFSAAYLASALFLRRWHGMQANHVRAKSGASTKSRVGKRGRS